MLNYLIKILFSGGADWGRKFAKGLIAASIGIYMWASLPVYVGTQENPILVRPTHTLMFLGYFAACFCIYSFFNVKTKQVINNRGDKKN